ncbi:MAG: hypothetical protein R2837_08475 [Aliarcobacter sp.]
MKYEFSDEEIKELYKTIGKNVKKYRIEKGYTQLDLTYEMGNKSVRIYSLDVLKLCLKKA